MEIFLLFYFMLMYLSLIAAVARLKDSGLFGSSSIDYVRSFCFLQLVLIILLPLLLLIIPFILLFSGTC